MQKPYKMRGFVLPVLFLQVSVISSAPLQQWLQANQITPLQQQLPELQAMQQFYPMPRMEMNTLSNQPQPIIIILPDEQFNIKTELKSGTPIERREKEELTPKTKEEDDSIVIDAEPIPTIEGRKAVILLPNGRFSIGGIISSIPFLPIEINVPDTISWIGSGISGIISGFFQNLPFQRPSQSTMSNVAVKSNINMQTNNQYSSNIMKPILMIPMAGINQQFLPIQL